MNVPTVQQRPLHDVRHTTVGFTLVGALKKRLAAEALDPGPLTLARLSDSDVIHAVVIHEFLHAPVVVDAPEFR